MTLGRMIRELRQSRGWTQDELGRRTGLRRGHVSRLESDDYRNPRVNTFLRLAGAFEIEPEELFRVAGYLRGRPRTATKQGPRSLAVVLREAQEKCDSLEVVEVPLLGIGSAGVPRAENNIEGYVPIPKQYLGTTTLAGLYALRVEGESLAGGGIHDGEFVVVDPSSPMIDGKLYAVRLLGQTKSDHEPYLSFPILRHVYVEDGSLKLVPSDESYPVIEAREEQVEVLGRVVSGGIWRSYS